MATKKKKITIIIITTVLVLAAANAYFFWPQLASWFRNIPSQFENPNDPNSKAAIEKQTEQEKLYANASEKAQTEGLEAGQQVLDQALLQAEDDTEKAIIYQQKASLSTPNPTAENRQASLSYAREAERIDPTYGTAIMIAQMEDYVNKNLKEALKYYKLYIQRLDSNAEQLNPGDRQNIEKRIVELEAQV